jgi:hypothetical protein
MGAYAGKITFGRSTKRERRRCIDARVAPERVHRTPEYRRRRRESDARADERTAGVSPPAPPSTLATEKTTPTYLALDARERFSFVNDPSAGSPTETLLRLLLPLNDQV